MKESPGNTRKIDNSMPFGQTASSQRQTIQYDKLIKFEFVRCKANIYFFHSLRTHRMYLLQLCTFILPRWWSTNKWQCSLFPLLLGKNVSIGHRVFLVANLQLHFVPFWIQFVVVIYQRRTLRIVCCSHSIFIYFCINGLFVSWNKRKSPFSSLVFHRQTTNGPYMSVLRLTLERCKRQINWKIETHWSIWAKEISVDVVVTHEARD